MKKTLFLTLTLIISVNIWAKQVTKKDAKQLARNFFWEKSGMLLGDISMK